MERMQDDVVFQNVAQVLTTNVTVPKIYQNGVGNVVRSAVPPAFHITVQEFLKFFLLFDMERPICKDCMVSFRMSCVLLFETMEYEDLSPAAKSAVAAVQAEATVVLKSLKVPRKKRKT